MFREVWLALDKSSLGDEDLWINGQTLIEFISSLQILSEVPEMTIIVFSSSWDVFLGEVCWWGCFEVTECYFRVLLVEKASQSKEWVIYGCYGEGPHISALLISTVIVFFAVSRIVLSRAMFWPYLHLSLGMFCSEVCSCMLALCVFHMALMVTVPVLFPQSRHQQCFSLPGLMD